MSTNVCPICGDVFDESDGSPTCCYGLCDRCDTTFVKGNLFEYKQQLLCENCLEIVQNLEMEEV